jgi:hypothetical protein
MMKTCQPSINETKAPRKEGEKKDKIEGLESKRGRKRTRLKDSSPGKMKKPPKRANRNGHINKSST